MNPSHNNPPHDGSAGAKPEPADAGGPVPKNTGGDSAEESWPIGDDLINELERLRAQSAECNQRYLRTLADFQNYQRRALQNEQTAKVEGMTKAIERIFTVLDHFDLALNQDVSKVTAAQILGGVKLIRDEFSRVLGTLGVTPLAPAPNDEFVPGRHEAVMQQPAEGIDPGCIVATFQPGYALATGAGERVLRAAKVSVAPKNES